MSERCIPVAQREEWESALAGVDHAFAHTWDNCYAMQQSSGLTTFLYVYENSSARVLCPVAERPFGPSVDIVTPYGFSGFIGRGDTSGFLSAWHRFALERDYVCGYFSQHPLLAWEGLSATEELRSRSTVFVLDLSLPEGTLFANTSALRRRQHRSWSKAGAPVIKDGDAEREFFVTRCSAFLRERGASDLYNFSSSTLRQLVASNHTLVLGASDDGRVVAAALFGFSSGIVEYYLHAAEPEGRQYSALLIWAAIRHFKGLGARWLNLGGGVQPGDGVSLFKQLWGGDELPYRVIRQVYRPDLYTQLCHSAGIAESDETYFPAYRRGWLTSRSNPLPVETLADAPPRNR